MCFSAGASFTGSAVLSAIGIASVRSAHEPSDKLFAGIPLFFAIQQCAEGVVWLTLRSGENQGLGRFAAYIFLLMALVIWPVMIPLAVGKMEKNEKREKIIHGILFGGVILSFYYSYCLMSFSVTPVINGFHIQYVNNFPGSMGLAAFGVYIIATMTPLFISTVKRMYLFGILIFISCAVTGFFYKEYLTSVWCFFAALISCIVYWIVKESHIESHSVRFRVIKA